MSDTPGRRSPLADRQTLLLVVYAVAALVIAFLPASQASGRLFQINMFIMLHMVLALGLNVVVGWVGLLDLGYVGFILAGVYTTVILSDAMTVEHTAVAAVDGVHVLELAGHEPCRLPTRGERVTTTFALGWVVPAGGDAAVAVQAGATGVVTAVHATPGETLAAGAPLVTVRHARPFAFVLVMAAAGLVAAVLGLVRGIPILRLRDDYFAIVTFAFAEIIYSFVRNEAWLTGGPSGYPNPYSPELGFLRLAQDTRALYLFVAAAVVVTVIAMHRLERSRIGRAWLAIKADETSARCTGIAVNRYKLLAFAISAWVAGLGGALFGFQYYHVSTNTFDFWLSVIVLSCIVLGGMGSIRGVLVGTIVLVGASEVLRDVLAGLRIDERTRMLFYGAVMLGIMVFRPQGLFPPRLRVENLRTPTTRARLFALKEGGERG